MNTLTAPGHGAQQPARRKRSRLVILIGSGFVVAAAAIATLGALTWLDRAPARVSSPEPTADAATIARGAYLARVGNCATCHTTRGGQPYAGGRGLPTPFGTVYAGNLTPDADTGLGRWNVDDFWQALHHGRSRDGRLLSPAFPYTAFTHVSRSDSDALYVFLRSLPPVSRPAPASGLRFPFNTQAALAFWRALYFDAASPDPAPAAGPSAQWQRGAYLVRGLGHCAACHAPRNAWGATQQAEQLPGGAMPQQTWFAPSLAPRATVALSQQKQALIDLLRSGQSLHGTASGPMSEVVTNSTQHWSGEDLEATAVYLLSLAPQPSLPSPGPLSAADSASAEAQRRRGALLYGDRCAQCHGDQGEGAPGIYPPLSGNPSVTLADPGNALQVLRHGGFSPATKSQPRPFGMPPSGLSAQELADVLTYVRQSWGNQATAVTVLQSLRAP